MYILLIPPHSELFHVMPSHSISLHFISFHKYDTIYLALYEAYAGDYAQIHTKKTKTKTKRLKRKTGASKITVPSDKNI